MNLKVSTRIKGGFFITTVLLVIVSVTSFITLDKINDSFHQVNVQTTPSLKLSKDIEVNVMKMKNIELQLFHTKDLAELTTLKEKYLAEEVEIKKSLKIIQDKNKNSSSVKMLSIKVNTNINETEDQFIAFYNQRKIYLSSKAQYQDLFTQIEDKADEGSSILLDFQDNINSKPTLKIAVELEERLANFISIASDLIISKDIRHMPAFENDVKIEISVLKELLSSLPEKEGSELSNLSIIIQSLSDAFLGSGAIIDAYSNKLLSGIQSTELLIRLELKTDETLANIDLINKKVTLFSVDIKSEIKSNMASSNMANLIITSISVLLSIIISLYTIKEIITPLAQVNKVLNTVASGDLTAKVDTSRSDEFGELADNCNSLIESLKSLINGISSRASQLAIASEETSAITQESLASIDSQRNQVEQIATATTEMSSTSATMKEMSEETLKNISDSYEEAEKIKVITEENRNTILNLSDAVDSATVVINKLNERSESIGSILDVIRNIAEQTNLLALNAAIEAARAGEQGRGFAVVADEVRNLASKTQSSTQEIQQMIELLQSGAGEAVDVMRKEKEQTELCVEQTEKANRGLQIITELVSKAHDMSSNITNAATEQNVVSTEISGRLEDIVAIAEQTSNGATQTATSSQKVAKLSEELQESVRMFTI